MSLDFSLRYLVDGNEIEVFSSNITHNLNTMADKAEIYKALWRPEEIKATKAKDIIIILECGLKNLRSNPVYFKKFNSENKWGTYGNFVTFVEEVLNNCKKYPNANIYISR